MNNENRAAVCGNRYIGGLVESRISFVTVVIVARQIRRGRGINRRPHLSGSRPAVVILIRSRVAGIIILLQHVDDGVVDRLARPLGIERGVCLYLYGSARRLCQLLVQIPPVEFITIAGRLSGRNRLLHFVRYGSASHEAAAVGFVGKGEVLAGVLHFQFLTLGLGDRSAFRRLKNRIVIRLDGRRNMRAKNTFDLLTFDFGVTVAGQVFQFVDKVVLSRKLDILDFKFNFIVVFFCKVFLVHGDRGLLRIINRGSADILSLRLRRCRGCECVRRFFAISVVLIFLRFEYELFAIILCVPVLDFNFIDLILVELGDNRHVAVHDRVLRHFDFRIRSLKNPLIKYLSGHEGVLRHLTDLFPRRAEVLGESFRFRTVFIQDYKVDIKLILECRSNGEIGSDCLAALVLCFADKPTCELFAFDHRFLRKSQRVTRIIGISLIGLTFHHVGDGEDLLGIFSPNRGILGNGNLIVEISASIYPLAGISSLLGNSRNIVQAVAGIRVDGLGSDHLLWVECVILIERDGIGNLLIIRDNRRVFGGHILCVNSLTHRTNLSTLRAFNDFADRPVGNVVLTGNGGRKLSADRFALRDFYSRVHVRVTVVEGHRPGRIRRSGRLFRSIAAVCGLIASCGLNGRNVIGRFSRFVGILVFFFRSLRRSLQRCAEKIDASRFFNDSLVHIRNHEIAKFFDVHGEGHFAGSSIRLHFDRLRADKVPYACGLVKLIVHEGELHVSVRARDNNIRCHSIVDRKSGRLDGLDVIIRVQDVRDIHVRKRRRLERHGHMCAGFEIEHVVFRRHGFFFRFRFGFFRFRFRFGLLRFFRGEFFLLFRILSILVLQHNLRGLVLILRARLALCRIIFRFGGFRGFGCGFVHTLHGILRHSSGLSHFFHDDRRALFPLNGKRRDGVQTQHHHHGKQHRQRALHQCCFHVFPPEIPRAAAVRD